MSIGEDRGSEGAGVRAFKDHFSGHADAYARHRPGYPAALFDWLAARAPGRALAWDAGTGNGQVARGLAAHFDTVYASDASAEQLAEARAPDNVRFENHPAEASDLQDGSVDLVCVGQALHWFDLHRFYAEVHRVLRPGGLFAAWTYQLNRVDPVIDGVVAAFYEDVVGPYWPPERVHVERGYEDLAFPFEALGTPSLDLVTSMSLDDFLNYIDTWSAVRRFRTAQGHDPLPELGRALTAAWGQDRRSVRWPLVIRAGRVNAV